MTIGKDDPAWPRSMQESFISILLVDVANAMKRLSQANSQSTRRDLVRSAFAAIEGLVWNYQQHISSTASDMFLLSNDETLALSEKSVHVDEQGKIKKQTRFITLVAMFRLTTRIAARIDQALKVDFEGAGWSSLRRTQSIRNRITHPKRHTDLTISESDIETCLAAFFWIAEVSTEAMAASNSAFARHVRELWQIVDQLKSDDPLAWEEYRKAANALES